MSYLIRTKFDAFGGMDGSRKLYKGGGGGTREATDEEKALWTAQANSLNQMTNIAMPALTTSTNNLGTMAGEDGINGLRDRTHGYIGDYDKSVSGGLDAYGNSMKGIYDNYGSQMRSETAANTAGAIANSNGQLERSLRSRGVNPNSGAFAAGANANSIRNAGLLAGGQNAVSKDLAEKQGALQTDMAGRRLDHTSNVASLGLNADNAIENTAWDRNAAIAGLASGVGGMAVNGTAGLSNTLANNRNASNQANATSSAGMGTGAMYLASKMMADGGEVHMAGGGSIGLQNYKKAAMPARMSLPTFESFGGGDDGRTRGTNMPIIAGSMGSQAYDLYKSGAMAAPKTYSDMANAAREGAATTAISQSQAAEQIAGAQAGEQAANAALKDGMHASPWAAAAQAGLDIASGEDPTKAVGNAAGGWAGAEAGATAGATFGPWGAAIGGVLGGLGGSSLFADGGRVGLRRDMRPGGHVAGPGTETSDSIPARLSDGEFVMSKPAVLAIGKGKLNKLNRIGLQVRKGDITQAEAKKKTAEIMRGAR